MGHFGRFWHIRRISGLGVIPEMLACRDPIRQTRGQLTGFYML
jgi:hypothetical protein